MTRPVEMLSGGQRQVVALARSAIRVTGETHGVLLLDEPTAALGYEQTKQVEALIRRMADEGIAIVLVTHNLPLCQEVADRIVDPQPRQQGRRRARRRDRDRPRRRLDHRRPPLAVRRHDAPRPTRRCPDDRVPVRRVLVVGGGITGGVLVARARAARRRGRPRRPPRAELGGVGHGITLQGNALKAFHAVGVYDRIAERGFAFDKLRLRPPTATSSPRSRRRRWAARTCRRRWARCASDVADVLADEVVEAGVDVRLGTTVTAIDDHGDSVTATLSDGSTETVDLLVGADGIRSKVRSMIGIDAEPQPVGMGIWRVVAKRPAEMECSEVYYGGPKYKAGYTPISDDLCYAFLLEEQPRPLLRRRAPERRAAQGARPGVRRHLGRGARQPRRRRGRQLPVDRGGLRRGPVVPRPHDHHRRRRARLPAADRPGRRDVRRGRGGAGRDAHQRRRRRRRCCRRSWSAASRG